MSNRWRVLSWHNWYGSLAPLLLLIVVLSVAVTLAPGRDGMGLPVAPLHIVSLAGRTPAPDAWRPDNGPNCLLCRLEPGSRGEPPAWRMVPPGGPSLPPGIEEKGKPRLRLNFFTAQRAYPKTTLPRAARLRAWEQVQALNSQLRRAVALPRWESIGPAGMKNSSMGTQKVRVSGRVKAIVVDPRNSNVVYVGAAQGGVWKTTNGGNSWQPLTDDQPSLAVGALALDPKRPDTIYVGTGEPHPGLDNYYGVGILKSTNGGRSWRRLGADVFTGLGIASLIVHPNNSSVLYAASALTGVFGPAVPVRGVFKSTDGGASWKGLIGCRDCRGASDLLMDPSDPNVLFAAFWQVGIFKSTDGGASWAKLTTGLPDANFGRIELAMSPSNPRVLYAGYHYTVPGRFDGGIVFKSTDGGASWTWLQQAPNYCGGQCWYDNIIAVHPTDPNTVYLGGSANYEWQPITRIKQVVVRSTDGGQTWQDLSPNDSPARTLHPDMHAIAFDPKQPTTVWVGTDGGVWKSTDGGRNWINRNTNLATLQFTGIAVHPNKPNIVFGGMQDNNKARTTGAITWDALDVGDGGHAAIDPFNPRIYYGSRYGISFQRNDKNGSAPVDDWPVKTDGVGQRDRALFYAPFALDPSTPRVLYYGTHRLYRTTDRGDSWTPISGDLTKGEKTRGRISTIAVAPSDPRTIYVGTSDGNVQVTTNQGNTWTNVTRAPLPNRWVSEVIVAPTDARTAYAVFNGFNSHTPGQPGHVFKTTNAGASWQNISGNLPDVPVLSIVLDPDSPGTLYIGTDVGVFRSTNDGATWQPFDNGLPNVAVVDLVLDANAGLLFAGTHGRSVFRVRLRATGTTPTATATATSGPSPTPTPTYTPTPTRPSFTPRGAIHLPAVLKGLRQVVTTPTHTPVGTVMPTRTPTPTPTMTPTATPTVSGPTPTPTSVPSPRVYYDDFSSAGSGWYTGRLGSCQFAYTGGTYGVAVTQLNQICVSSAPASAQANGVYEVKARKASANDGSIYGLVFGLDDPSAFRQFYVFWVDPSDQTYLLQRYDNGTWTNLTQVGTSDAIKTRAQVNVLRARRQGDRITLYVNGVNLGSVVDATFAGNGYMGVAGWAGYNATSAITYFDDFTITVPTQVLSDTFNNPTSGWPVGANEVCQAEYRQGEYLTATQPNWVCVFRAPVGPYPNGRFEVTAHRQDSVYPVAYGIAFGEDGTFSSLYAFLVIPDTQEYALVMYNGSWWGIVWDEAEDDAWVYSSAIRPGTATNTLRVEYDGGRMDLFVNDRYLESVWNTKLLGNGYFGVVNRTTPQARCTSTTFGPLCGTRPRHFWAKPRSALPRHRCGMRLCSVPWPQPRRTRDCGRTAAQCTRRGLCPLASRGHRPLDSDTGQRKPGYHRRTKGR